MKYALTLLTALLLTPLAAINAADVPKPTSKPTALTESKPGTAVAPTYTGKNIVPVDLKARQRQAAWRKRRIIMNNVGNDCFLMGGKEFSVTTDHQNIHEDFLRARTSPLVGSQVDSLFYCTGVFNSYLHQSEESELMEAGDNGVQTIARELIKTGDDALKTVVEFGHRQKWEVFWSMRMNDTHDSGDGTLLTKWKQSHPECLMASKGGKMSYGGGRWSALNYDMDAVREKVFRICMDVATRYDIDGIELDFFRHPLFFKTQVLGEPVTQSQCDKMTALLAQVRRGTLEAARSRKRPLLISVRVMDSPGYAKAIGLDVEKWLKDGLIDVLVVGGCYFHLEPYQTMARMGHEHDVPVYACLSASRLKAEDKLWRGEALDAWAAGVDGIYTFNLFDPRHRLFRELGDPAALKGLPAESRYVMGEKWWINFLKDGERFGKIAK